MGPKDDQNKLDNLAIFQSSLKVGALAGSAGIVYGGASSILRSLPHSIIHTFSSGIHWFACGSSFWWLRSNILRINFEDNATSKQLGYTSAFSGGIAGGSITRLMGGRLVPGVVVYSLLGYVGQSSFNAVEKWRLENAQSISKPLLQRMADSRWVPLRSLSDEDYKRILNEKLLSIETEIALLDEKILEIQSAEISRDDNNSSPHS
ncbi:hypothetical protein Egran_06546 [Elaphomyces granulatus]|uniref:Uncharacterized protein n=1 Tax=Elaphomyces granulatus TaxID=519963 RepID=A0A232LNG8_9EURO|nr:hypothetical protein Egran_06546 [Elaphomyces granulatus]